jgi:hypothetical protein
MFEGPRFEHTRSQIFTTYGITVTKESLFYHVYVDIIYIHESVNVVPTTNSDHDLINVETKRRKPKNHPMKYTSETSETTDQKNLSLRSKI